MGFGLCVDLSCSIIFVSLSGIYMYYITFFKAIDVLCKTNNNMLYPFSSGTTLHTSLSYHNNLKRTTVSEI